MINTCPIKSMCCVKLDWPTLCACRSIVQVLLWPAGKQSMLTFIHTTYRMESSFTEVLTFTPHQGAFAHGAMGRRIDPSWDGPIELFLVQASTPRLV